MSRYTDRKEALKLLNQIDSKKENYLIIHYSCESFIGKKGLSPRITSIAVSNFQDNQTDLFAIYRTAERMGYNFKDITDNYDSIEKEMLNEFFDFVKLNPKKKWIHWNMNDSIFGFKAIEHRYAVLGGSPTLILDENKISLSTLFLNLYGEKYIEDPRIEKLILKNKWKPKNFLSGREEAEFFETEKYYELSMSTISKIKLFNKFINSAIKGTLKTDIKKMDLYGNDLKGRLLLFKETTIFKVFIWVLTTILATYLGMIIERL